MFGLMIKSHFKKLNINPVNKTRQYGIAVMKIRKDTNL